MKCLLMSVLQGTENNILLTAVPQVEAFQTYLFDLLHLPHTRSTARIDAFHLLHVYFLKTENMNTPAG